MGEVLKAIVHPLTMGVLFLATVAMLTANYFGYLPEPAVPFLGWIWVVAFIATAASLIHFALLLGELWSARRSKSNSGKIANTFLYGKYEHFDAHEESILRLFIDHHQQRLGFDTIATTPELRTATRRLIDRNFLFIDQPSYRSLEEYNRQFVVMFDEHYRILMSRPDLIGSKAPSRGFG